MVQQRLVHECMSEETLGPGIQKIYFLQRTCSVIDDCIILNDGMQ